MVMVEWEQNQVVVVLMVIMIEVKALTPVVQGEALVVVVVLVVEYSSNQTI